MGQGIKEFKKATRDATGEMERALDDPPDYTPPTPKISEPVSGDDSKKDA